MIFSDKSDTGYRIFHFDDTLISLEDFVKSENKMQYLHRTDGPAIEWQARYHQGKNSGIMRSYRWFIHGIQYNPNGCSDLTILNEDMVSQEDYTNESGQLHRLDGPASFYRSMVDSDYTITRYYLFDKPLRKEDYDDAIDFLNENGMEAFILRYK